MNDFRTVNRQLYWNYLVRGDPAANQNRVFIQTVVEEAVRGVD